MFDEKLTEIKDTFGKKMKRYTGLEYDTGYKYVYVVSYDGLMTYRAEFKNPKFNQCFATAKKAASTLDLFLMKSKPSHPQVNNTWKEVEKSDK